MKIQYRLVDELEGQLLKLQEDGALKHVNVIGHADGVRFLCPKCFRENKGPVGTHSVVLFFSNCPRAKELMGHSGWNAAGNDLSDLTFTGPGAASVLIKGGCNWHGFVKSGYASII